jgi:hypothetical protein
LVHAPHAPLQRTYMLGKCVYTTWSMVLRSYVNKLSSNPPPPNFPPLATLPYSATGPLGCTSWSETTRRIVWNCQSLSSRIQSAG